MINPSANGWIDKFFAGVPAHSETTSTGYYQQVRNTGFVYGHVIEVNHFAKKQTWGWTAEEMTKVALLDALFGIYCLETGMNDSKGFIKSAIGFYKEMTPEGFNILQKVLPSSPTSYRLEDILDERVHTNENIVSRNFSHILTNALLFMDVLGFRQYLLNGELPEKYMRKLEETIIRIVLLALRSKKKQTEYDNLLIMLFESSVRYTKLKDVNADTLNNIETGYYESELEKFYLMDIAGMAIWTDGMTDENEINFLYALAQNLGIDDETAAESIASFDVFIRLHKKDIPYFNYTHPVKHFYDHAAQTVMLLINRNRKRLAKELSNNAELMLLLTHSTHRSLNAGEKKKMKKQLLEICKTVPSLAIFLLPGGSLLLPLLIKFIPQLLPSMFNENLEKDQ